MFRKHEKYTPITKAFPKNTIPLSGSRYKYIKFDNLPKSGMRFFAFCFFGIRGTGGVGLQCVCGVPIAIVVLTVTLVEVLHV